MYKIKSGDRKIESRDPLPNIIYGNRVYTVCVQCHYVGCKSKLPKKG